MDPSEIKELRDELSTQFASLLDAKLAGLELSIVRQLADQLKGKADAATVDQHDKRLRTLEESRAAREHMGADVISLGTRVGALETAMPDNAAGRLVELEKFRWSWPSVAAIAAVAAVAMAVVYVLTYVR